MLCSIRLLDPCAIESPASPYQDWTVTSADKAYNHPTNHIPMEVFQKLYSLPVLPNIRDRQYPPWQPMDPRISASISTPLRDSLICFAFLLSFDIYVGHPMSSWNLGSSATHSHCLGHQVNLGELGSTAWHHHFDKVKGQDTVSHITNLVLGTPHWHIYRQPSSDLRFYEPSDCWEYSDRSDIITHFYCESHLVRGGYSTFLNITIRTIEVMILSFRRSQHALLALAFFVAMVLVVFSTLL